MSDAVSTVCVETIGATSLLATGAGSEKKALPSCRPASAIMIAAAAIRIGLRRALSRSPILSAFTGPVTVDCRFSASASEAEAWAERREAAKEEDLEGVETALLTEFHKWASPVEMRQRSQTALLRALDAEVEALKERVEKLEGGRQQ